MPPPYAMPRAAMLLSLRRRRRLMMPSLRSLIAAEPRFHCRCRLISAEAAATIAAVTI